MLKILGKLVAAWLTAFAIAGTTVWAGPDEDTTDGDASKVDHVQPIESASASPAEAAD